MSLKARLLGGGDEAIARARRPKALTASHVEAPNEGIVRSVRARILQP